MAVLKQVEAGTQVAELIRHVGISEQTFYCWKRQYAGLQTDHVRQLKLLQGKRPVDTVFPNQELLGRIGR